MRYRSIRSLAGIVLTVLAALLALPAADAAELVLPVPRVTIYPGDVIDDGVLAERAFIAHTVSLSTVNADRKRLIGKVAKRTLLPGQPIPVIAVRDAYLVSQGKTALVVFQDGGLVITGNALALQNGSPGEVVSLRNVDSGVIIKGTVMADGTVHLGGP